MNAENVQEFLDEYNVLVIDECKVTHYQLLNGGNEEMWHTFMCPVESEKVLRSINNLSYDLPTGNHYLKLQAVGARGVMGQIGIAIEGRSPHAKKASNDLMSQAKATAMNVATAENQLNSMAARLQAADERAREAEDRAGSMISEVYKMSDVVQKMMMQSEMQTLEREERESRMQAFQTIAEALAPVIGTAVTIGSRYMEHKVKMWEADMAQEAASKNTPSKAN